MVNSVLSNTLKDFRSRYHSLQTKYESEKLSCEKADRMFDAVCTVYLFVMLYFLFTSPFSLLRTVALIAPLFLSMRVSSRLTNAIDNKGRALGTAREVGPMPRYVFAINTSPVSY
jgi:hypothetical protein